MELLEKREGSRRKRQRYALSFFFLCDQTRHLCAPTFRPADALDPFRLASRWIARGVDPFINITLCFRVGFVEEMEKMAKDRVGSEDDDDDLEIVDKDAVVDAL